MAAEGSGRPLLPQTTQMQSFSFAPPTLAPRENQRNYVFVDEHNRHKRLKVMRACEGCRKRKIKCDAATTNSWPCAACVRLKLNCIPPAMSFDKDSYAPGSFPFDNNRSQEYHAAAGPSTAEGYHGYSTMQPHMAPEMNQPMPQSAPAYPEGSRMYPPGHYMDAPPPQPLQYAPMQPPLQPPVEPASEQMKYTPQPIYAAPPQQGMASPGSESAWRSENVSQLADTLGELKIDHTAIAPYITNQKKFLAEAPAVEEFEFDLPQHTGPSHAVKIPVEMMPSEGEALRYFEFFFANIYPYVPVINRNYFYRQWQNDRESMSPLLLEAIFACSSLMLGDTAQGNKWLALASKHEESFKDVPRLSTIQAELLILKARESAPKRGYFYRSWVSVESIIGMAKELDLHEHREIHAMGKSCDSSPSECVAKTKIWLTLFVVEMMIGAPQGRSEFGVNLDTVDFGVPRPLPGQPPEEHEYQVSRQFTYFARLVKLISRSNDMHFRLRKTRKDWANDPAWVQHNQGYAAWIQELPQDMQVVYPTDGSMPWIPSHFVANLHCYYNLAIIMHHRPQIHFLADTYDGAWKHHMFMCYSAAKSMCRLQEAILHNYGLPGLLYQQRGISFTIYAVLTCTMLHLAAITAPDSELNTDAREFFVSHMRILEQVAPSWPMPEVHVQINNLRAAFSADTSKPFELKPTFPLGSPQSQNNPSPINTESQYRSRGSGHSPSIDQPGQVNYHTHPITPPISAHEADTKADSPVVQSLVMMAAGQRQPSTSTSLQGADPLQWNPKGIFDQWNTAFGTPPPTSSSQSSSPPLRQPQPGTSFEVRTPQDAQSSGFNQVPNVSPHSTTQVHGVQQLPTPVSFAPSTQPYVTPSMWQDVVANSFSGGVKRRWDYNHPSMLEQGQAAKRR